MVLKKPEIKEGKQPPHQYQSTRFYESITGKWNDARLKKEDADQLKKLGRSGIPVWKIFNTVLQVINKHPTIREEIVSEIEERR